MPTYAYACKNCGHRFDAVQSFSEPALTECPNCGGPLRKEYGSIGVTFHGSGFYRTDSRQTGASTASSTGKSGAASDTSGPSSASSKSESSTTPTSAS